MNRKLLVAAFGLAGVIGMGGAAEAQSTDPRCYPVVTAECPAAITISDTTVVIGESVTATATGLDPNTPATGTANSTPLPLGTKTVSNAGTVSFTFAVPADFEAGPHSVTVTGIKNGASTTLVVGFTVSAAGVTPTTAGNNSLPRTGDDSSLPLTQGGVALLALGGGAVYVAKRHKATAAA